MTFRFLLKLANMALCSSFWLCVAAHFTILAQEPDEEKGQAKFNSLWQSPVYDAKPSQFSDPTFNSSRADEIDVAALIRESHINGAAMHKQLLDFTYTLKQLKRTLNDHGKIEREQLKTFEAYPVDGQHVLINLSENNRPLSPLFVIKDRKRAGEDIERAEREALKRNHGNLGESGLGQHFTVAIKRISSGKYAAIRFDLSDFLRFCEFSAPRRERFHDRDAILLVFRPRDDLKLPAATAFITKLVGRVWIDEIDKVVIRLEGWPAPELAAATKTSEKTNSSRLDGGVIYEQTRLPAGVWFPSLIRINPTGCTSLFNGFNWDVTFEFSDYKRFSTDVEDVKIETLKTSP